MFKLEHQNRQIALHEEFRQKMQDVNEAYLREHVQPAPLDGAMLREIRQTRRKRLRQKVVRSAAVLLIIIMVSIPFNIWLNAEGIYGGKQVAHRIVTVFSPLDIEAGPDEDGFWRETATIDNFADVKDATIFFEEIYVPQYVPAGYQFQELTLRKNLFGTTYYYTYRNADGQELSIDYAFDEYDSDLSIYGEPFDATTANGQLHVQSIKETGEYAVIQLTDTYFCTINGIGNFKTGVKIVENMKRLEK